MSDDVKPGEREVEELLQSLMPKQRPPRDERRFRFALGLIALSPFCVAIGFFPWPAAQLVDKLMWVGFALALLVIGGWQLDKSNKVLSGKTEPGDDGDSLDAAQPTRSSKVTLRQVK